MKYNSHIIVIIRLFLLLGSGNVSRTVCKMVADKQGSAIVAHNNVHNGVLLHVGQQTQHIASLTQKNAVPVTTWVA